MEMELYIKFISELVEDIEEEMISDILYDVDNNASCAGLEDYFENAFENVLKSYEDRGSKVSCVEKLREDVLKEIDLDYVNEVVIEYVKFAGDKGKIHGVNDRDFI